MKTFRKSPLASAVLAAATGLAMLGMASTVNADSDRLEEELQQEVLIFPYYTVRDGWTTLTNVTNTSPYTLVVKVRYRESYNSRDVLDFNIVMSPFDVWTGWVAEGPNGPRLHTRDNSCTTPIFEDAGDGSRYADFSSIGYQQDGGPTGIDRLREGHFEFLTMAQFFPGAEDEKHDSSGDYYWDDGEITIRWNKDDPMYPTAYYAKHENGKPRDCTIVDSRFEATRSQPSHSDFMDGDFDSDGDPLAEYDNYMAREDWPTETFCCDADDPLRGEFGLVNVGKGIAFGGVAHAPDDGFCDFRSRDLITAQQYPWFLEPTLYSKCEGSGYGSSGLWGWRTEYSHDMDVAAANNGWSTNDNTGAATDWVITFPTKAFHVDISSTDPYAGASSARMLFNGACSNSGGGDKPWTCDLWTKSDFQKTFLEAFLDADGLDFYGGGGGFEEYFGETADGQSCDEVVYNLWDREEEGVAGSGTSISPAPPQPIDSLCYESNVLAFQDESTLGSALAVKVDTSVLTSGAAAGWLKLQFDTNCTFNKRPDDDDGDDYCPGNDELPAVGFAVRSRDFGDPTRNFGVLSEHGWDD